MDTVKYSSLWLCIFFKGRIFPGPQISFSNLLSRIGPVGIFSPTDFYGVKNLKVYKENLSDVQYLVSLAYILSHSRRLRLDVVTLDIGSFSTEPSLILIF